jgi:hypothetical protein
MFSFNAVSKNENIARGTATYFMFSNLKNIFIRNSQLFGQQQQDMGRKSQNRER